jgi:putative transposase
VVSAQAKREAVGILTAEGAIGVTRACGLVGISRSLYGYRSCRSPALELRNRIAELAAMKRAMAIGGFKCCFVGRVGR